MTVWLASYPHSGDTVLRTLLHRALGVRTRSLHGDKGDICNQPRSPGSVGQIGHGLTPAALGAQADETFFIATHDAPQDDAKAIYIVRDGRSSIMSYFQYLKSSQAGTAPSITDITLGYVRFSSWSEHFEAWSPRQRSDTLLVRYDDIAGDPVGVVESVAAFAGLPVQQSKMPSSTELQGIISDLVRSENDAGNIVELQGDDLNLFWLMHGRLMVELGYVEAVPDIRDFARTCRRLRDYRPGSERDVSSQLAEVRCTLEKSEADRAARLSVILEREARIATLNGEVARQAALLAPPWWSRLGSWSRLALAHGLGRLRSPSDRGGDNASAAAAPSMPSARDATWNTPPEIVAFNAASTARALERIAARSLAISTVIDVGASNGMWSAVTRQSYPDATYFLIEAQRVHEPDLIKYCQGNPNTSYVLAAAGEHVGEIYFDDSAPFGGVASHVQTQSAQTVLPVTTIDHEVAERGLQGPFLVKLDTHGFEVPILKGAAATLKRTNLVVIEVYNFRIADGSLLFDEMCAYMRSQGFGVIDISEPLWRQRDGAFWQMDLFFVPLDRPEFAVQTYA